jgi:N-acetyl-gamma-glutamyl-phosphate reductase
MGSPLSVAVAGATGYSGQELVRLLARHPFARLTAAFGSEATTSPRQLPALARIWEGEIQPFSLEAIAGRVDAAFLALPEAVAAETAPALVASGVRVFDLSGAFRLSDGAARARWYPATPAEWPDGTAYGLPERHRRRVRIARLVACPGCYPTAAVLALGPLADAGLIDGDVIVDAKSGISGAGKAPSERTHFSENHGSAAAYGVFAHRHTAEMEQEIGRRVTFVPHLVPLDRGILETIYARLAAGTRARDVAGTLHAAYAEAPFVRLTAERLPEIKHVAHTNFCDIGWRVDEATLRLVLVACLDNLVKGAAGQAVQNLNVAFGFDERAGLL